MRLHGWRGLGRWLAGCCELRWLQAGTAGTADGCCRLGAQERRTGCCRLMGTEPKQMTDWLLRTEMARGEGVRRMTEGLLQTGDDGLFFCRLLGKEMTGWLLRAETAGGGDQGDRGPIVADCGGICLRR